MGDLNLLDKIKIWLSAQIAIRLPRRIVWEVVHMYFAEKADILGVHDYMALSLHQAWVAYEEPTNDK